MKSGIEGLQRGSRNLLIGQMKKISVFRVTLHYPNLLVKPKKISFSEKNIILCILKGKMPLKMHKIMYFFQKKNYNKCVPIIPYDRLKACRISQHAKRTMWIQRHARIQRGGGGQGDRSPPENHKNIEFLSKSGPDPLNN